MYVLKISEVFDNITFTDCTNIENEKFFLIFICLFLSMPSSLLFLYRLDLMIYTLYKLLSTNNF